MEKLRSNNFAKGSILIILAISAVFTFNGTFDQIAFAQESSEDIWIGPTTNALSSFFSQMAESLPQLIAAIILLIIGWIVASIIAKVIQKVATVALKAMNKDEDENATEGLSQVTSSKGSAKLISTVIKWFVFLFFVMAAVNALEFEQLTVAMTNLWLWIPNLLALYYWDCFSPNLLENGLNMKLLSMIMAIQNTLSWQSKSSFMQLSLQLPLHN